MAHRARSPSLGDNDVQLIVKEELDEPLEESSWDEDPDEGQDDVQLRSGDSEGFSVQRSPSRPKPDQWQHDTAEYKATSDTSEGPNYVNMVLSNLNQRPHLQNSNSEAEVPTERAEIPISSPILYPRSNPGIMSPLAKKKMLSQVSGTGLNNSYPFGPPPPLVNKNVPGSALEEVTAKRQCPQILSGVSEPSIMIKRPSVIQHAQSFKSRSSDERRVSVEASEREICPERDFYPSEVSQHQPLHQTQPNPLRTNHHFNVEKSTDMPGQVPSYLSDFYSSQHLHSIYRHAEHRLGKDLYPSRDSRDSERSKGFQHSDRESLTYSSRLNRRDEGSPSERSSDEQPTDLSLPKSSPHKLPHSGSSLPGPSHSMIHQDNKSTLQKHSLFQASGNQQQSSISDFHPRACRVPPMSVSAPKKVVEHLHKTHRCASYKLDEIAHRPILSAKSSQQNICAARPLKRSLDELENRPTEKKIRAVTPMHCSTPRDVSVKARTPEPDNESVKLVESAHINSYSTDAHKFHSSIFPGLYPGAFVSQVQDMCDSLGPHAPRGYSHPLQYLKNQAVISPLMPPFAIHSIMMQRQLLAQAANPAHLYRHPVGTPYGELLHHGLYPITPLNPQPAFSPTQLSSVHPSTKLS